MLELLVWALPRFCVLIAGTSVTAVIRRILNHELRTIKRSGVNEDVFETRGLALSAKGVALQDGGLPARYRGIAHKLAGNARATYAIWKDIANNSLQEREAQIILGCLEKRFVTALEVSVVLQTIIRKRDGAFNSGDHK